MVIIRHGINIGEESGGSGYVAINWGEGILTKNRNRLKAVEFQVMIFHVPSGWRQALP